VFQTLWSVPLTGDGIAGLVVADGKLIVSDRDAFDTSDIWRCLDAETGEEIWMLTYSQPGRLDYGNSPRATPVIDLNNNRVFLLSAFGLMHAVDFETGDILWRQNVVRSFGGTIPIWGISTSPILADGKLIVSPGGNDAALAALDPANGEVIGKTPAATPAEQTGYASPLVATFDGVEQVILYGERSLFGVELATGNRLWEHRPRRSGDFNVPTPFAVGNRLFVTTENNGSRLYEFDGTGKIKEPFIAQHDELSPDTSTPVMIDGKIFGVWHDLFVLDADSLRPLASYSDEGLSGYVMLIAGKTSSRQTYLLTVSERGVVLLWRVNGDECVIVDRSQPLGDADMLAHPALVGDVLYLRNVNGIAALRFEYTFGDSSLVFL